MLPAEAHHLCVIDELLPQLVCLQNRTIPQPASWCLPLCSLFRRRQQLTCFSCLVYWTYLLVSWPALTSQVLLLARRLSQDGARKQWMLCPDGLTIGMRSFGSGVSFSSR